MMVEFHEKGLGVDLLTCGRQRVWVERHDDGLIGCPTWWGKEGGEGSGAQFGSYVAVVILACKAEVVDVRER